MIPSSLLEIQRMYSDLFKYSISTHVGGPWHSANSVEGKISLDYLFLRSTYYKGQLYTLEELGSTNE